jgi:hypothetical protein
LAYTFNQTIGLSFGYNKIWGSKDNGFYNNNTGFSQSGKPNSEYFIAELDYIPFGEQTSFAYPWLNLRLALQYIGYTEFNGGSSNFNGSGRGDSNNNTLYLNGWLIF